MTCSKVVLKVTLVFVPQYALLYIFLLNVKKSNKDDLTHRQGSSATSYSRGTVCCQNEQY